MRKAHGDKVILDNVTLAFLPGAKIGVVGPNGMGKSTLLRMMAGVEQPSNGDARLMPGFTVGMLAQEPALDESKTVLGNVEEGVADDQGAAGRSTTRSPSRWRPTTPTSCSRRWASCRSSSTTGTPGTWTASSSRPWTRCAARRPDAEVSVLSGGERRRVALCALLLAQPDLLLLDEPTNHLDAESVQWLEQHLEKYPGTVVAVTHDRYFLDNVAQLDPGARPRPRLPVRGQLLDLPGDQGGPDQGRGPEGRQAAQALEDELEWVRSSPRARQAKSRARLERYEEMAAEADQNRKLDFEEIQIPPGPRLGTPGGRGRGA